MKTTLVFAVAVSMAAADCHLSASYKTLSASAVIPSVTTITDACCADVQTQITKYFNNLDSPWQPKPPSPARLYMDWQPWQDCHSFSMYMDQFKDFKYFNNLDSPPPDFKFKESVSGGGATACSLHAEISLFGLPPYGSVACDIPESTTISTECCDALQKALDLPPPTQPPSMTKCQSVMMWGKQRMGSVGTPPPGGPGATLEYMMKALPAGMSCTEKMHPAGFPHGSGMAGSMLNAILHIAEISGRSDVQELEAQPASSSLLPTIFVAGIAGSLGGLVAFFAVSKLSYKPQRVALISDDA